MKKHVWKTYALWILIAEAVGALSGWLTREGTRIYQTVIRQPPLSPPGFVFPIIWAILFVLMGVGAARIAMAPPSPERSVALRVWWLQLAFNFFWSIIFFCFERFGLALIWLFILWGMILWMIRAFSRVDRWAGWLQFPYLAWVTFAAYLNFGVWLLNR